MTKNTFLTTLFVCMAVLGVKAQTFTLSGTVCDEQGALPYATVMVWQGNDTVKATCGITNKQGDFALRGLSKGQYNGLVKFTGFEHLPFSVNLDKDVHMDTLHLVPDEDAGRSGSDRQQGL